MSIDASISITLSKSTHRSISPIEMIQALLDSGWTFNDYGKVSYLPVGDNNDYDWQREEMATSALMDILITKANSNEEIGVTMTWQDTNIGGIFSFRKKDNISINLIMNRKTYLDENNFQITDVNWYLTRLLPTFNQGEICVEYFTYEEHV